MSTPSHAPTRSLFPVAVFLTLAVGFPSFLLAQNEVPIDPATGLPATATPAANFVPGRMIGMRPEEKRPLTLKQNERNPYAKRGSQEESVGEETIDAEEQQIRARLSSLSVSGRSQGPNGLRILLGDIILEQGRVLPQLLEEQSESLKVLAIDENSVVLGWLDIETGESTGKKMQVTYDLTPMVSYALHGQESATVAEDGTSTGRRMGVLRPGRERDRIWQREHNTSPSDLATGNQESRIAQEVSEEEAEGDQ